MGSLHIKMQKSCISDLSETLEVLQDKLCNMGNSAEFTAEAHRDSKDTQIAMLTFEKYYMRNGSYAALTVLLTQSGSVQTADIIGFGGGGGMLNLSFGANKAFANEAKEILLDNGFSVEEA